MRRCTAGLLYVIGGLGILAASQALGLFGDDLCKLFGLRPGDASRWTLAVMIGGPAFVLILIGKWLVATQPATQAVRAIRLPNGNLLVAVGAQDSEGLNDLAEIGPEHPAYGAWVSLAKPGMDPR